MIVRCPRCREQVNDRNRRCPYCSAPLEAAVGDPAFAPAPLQEEEEAPPEPVGPVCQRCGSGELGGPSLFGAFLFPLGAGGIAVAAYAVLTRTGPARQLELPRELPEIGYTLDVLLVASATAGLFGVYRFLRRVGLRFSGARFCRSCGARVYA